MRIRAVQIGKKTLHSVGTVRKTLYRTMPAAKTEPEITLNREKVDIWRFQMLNALESWHNLGTNLRQFEGVLDMKNTLDAYTILTDWLADSQNTELTLR